MNHINIAKSRMEWIQVLEDAGEVPVLKWLQVRIHHSPYPPYRLKLLPGTKVSDVVAYLGLTKDYLLSTISDPTKTLTPEENLYDLISPDDKLIAKASIKIDSDKAREDLMSLLEVDDDPPSEPMDTSESDAYIRSFFKEEDLYAAVGDNAKLIVLSSYDATRILFKKLFPISSRLTEGMKK